MTGEPTKREPANDYHTYRPLWRLPVIFGVAAAGMLLWVVVRLIG